MQTKFALRAFFGVLLAVFLVASIITLKDKIKPTGGQSGPPEVIQINPPDPKHKDTKIIHKVTVPKDITKPTKVVDKVSSSDPKIKTNDGTATVTPNDDGSITVEIPETIRMTPKESKLKAVVTTMPDLMLGYSVAELNLLIAEGDLDILASFNSLGIGVSVEVKRVSVGIGEVYEFGNEFKTVIYVGYSF